MAFYRTQWILPFFTNLPQDVIVNTMHWYSDETNDDAEVGAIIAARLQTFYGTIYGTAGFRVNYANWTAVTLKVFNMADPPPAVPEVFVPAYDAGTNASGIPTEVAVVLSFHAAPVSGVRFQRLYNRIYLGALGATAMSGSGVASFPVVSSTFVTQVRNAAIALLAANDGVVDWRQHSKATGVDTFRTITGGWVDNSPDTQRRRSVNATLRNTW